MIRKFLGKLFGKKTSSTEKGPKQGKSEARKDSHERKSGSGRGHGGGRGEGGHERREGGRGGEPRGERREGDRGERREGDRREGDRRGGRRRRGRGGRGGGERGDRRFEDRPRERRGHDRREGEYRPGGEAAPEAPAETEAPLNEVAPEAVALEPAPEVPADNAFLKLGLDLKVVQSVVASGYQTPTPIQEQSVPVILSGKDLLGSAQTGTGKTAAFALPILSKLQSHANLRVLVLAPTRELALQVADSFKEYGKYTDLRFAIIYGGVGYGNQREAIKRGPDIMVATPGRLLDFLEQGEIDLSAIQHLIIDEADRMLDMGFIPDVRKIIGYLKKERQTLLFSATLPPEIESLAGWALHEPARVAITADFSPAETVNHSLYPVAKDQKFDLLCALLEHIHYNSVIIFTRTKMEADRIAARLVGENHSVAVLHSDRSQSERVKALEGFKAGTYEVMVATDIAARGLDIEGVSHVINYSVPESPEDYVHRIGRTGRAKSEGDALTLFTAEENIAVMAIEGKIGMKIPRKKLEGFNYAYTILFDPKAMAASRRRR